VNARQRKNAVKNPTKKKALGEITFNHLDRIKIVFLEQTVRLLHVLILPAINHVI